MSLAAPTRTAGVSGVDGSAPVAVGARRAPRHVLVGVVLMVASALLAGLWALRADPAVPVLAVARPVAAGQTITAADVQVVRVASGGVELVPESQRSSVVGATARVPLVAGSLLAAGQVGPADWPPAGHSVVGVAVAPGRMPADLPAGARVSVLIPAGASAEASEPLAASAVVVAVGQPGAAGLTSVTVLLDQVDARRVAAASEVVVILEHPGG